MVFGFGRQTLQYFPSVKESEHNSCIDHRAIGLEISWNTENRLVIFKLPCCPAHVWIAYSGAQLKPTQDRVLDIHMGLQRKE